MEQDILDKLEGGEYFSDKMLSACTSMDAELLDRWRNERAEAAREISNLRYNIDVIKKGSEDFDNMARVTLDYKNRMDFPMTLLADSLVGSTSDAYAGAKDAELVETAARKIVTLKKMLLAAGFNEAMLQAIMEN